MAIVATNGPPVNTGAPLINTIRNGTDEERRLKAVFAGFLAECFAHIRHLPERGFVAVEVGRMYLANALPGIGLHPKTLIGRLVAFVADVGGTYLRHKRATDSDEIHVQRRRGPGRRASCVVVDVTVARALIELRDSRTIPKHHPPSGLAHWLPLVGIDPTKQRGTCHCPHPEHGVGRKGRPARGARSGRPMAAWTANPDGTVFITCQHCRDGQSRLLSWFGVQCPDGSWLARMSNRAAAAEGRQGSADLGGLLPYKQHIRALQSRGCQIDDGLAEAAQLDCVLDRFTHFGTGDHWHPDAPREAFEQAWVGRRLVDPVTGRHVTVHRALPPVSRRAHLVDHHGRTVHLWPEGPALADTVTALVGPVGDLADQPQPTPTIPVSRWTRAKRAAAAVVQVVSWLARPWQDPDMQPGDVAGVFDMVIPPALITNTPARAGP